jgi:hypothetical protein
MGSRFRGNDSWGFGLGPPHPIVAHLPHLAAISERLDSVRRILRCHAAASVIPC